jgi:hypothetical protein
MKNFSARKISVLYLIKISRSDLDFYCPLEYNGHMLDNEKNLKDSGAGLALTIKDKFLDAHYDKLNKLIMALYMVTDIMEKEEPIRNKLRNLGTNMISDTHSNLMNIGVKISETMSFLDIASAVGMISHMNCNILKKEFSELKQSIEEYNIQSNPAWLEQFILNTSEPSPLSGAKEIREIREKQKIHQGHRTRIGVQKGSTLMKALSGVGMSDSVYNKPTILKESIKDNFDILKQQRRNEILKVIREKKEVYPEAGGATITDIRNMAKELSKHGTSVLASCSEKTLQRELISMLKDNVLKKTGEKRWSKYFV